MEKIQILTSGGDVYLALKSTWEWKTSLNIKSRQARSLYFPFLFLSSVLQSFVSFSGSSLFTISVTAHSPSGKELNPSSQEDIRFHGVAPGHAIFTSSYVIPLWDSATTHSPSAKKLKHSSQEDARFSMCSTLAYNFDFILCHPFLGLSNSSLTLP